MITMEPSSSLRGRRKRTSQRKKEEVKVDWDRETGELEGARTERLEGENCKNCRIRGSTEGLECWNGTMERSIGRFGTLGREEQKTTDVTDGI